MITKDKAVAQLKEKGYDATLMSGVVMVKVPTKQAEDIDKISKNMKKELDKMGYKASWGLVVAKKADLPETVPAAPAAYDSGEQLILDL